MIRQASLLLLTGLLALPLAAQNATVQDQETLNQAQLTLRAAEQAGAPTYAKTLYDEAAYRVHFAQENITAGKSTARFQAQQRAIEGLWAARAALSKARWVGTNEAVRSLQTDIVRFGGHSDVALTEEPANLELNRGKSSKDRIAFAQAVLDAAKAAGAQQTSADDLTQAQGRLESARRIVKSGGGSNETADSLAYIAEMMARRALYATRATDANRNLQPLQLERTRLAQAESERQAAAERAQREEAQRQAAALQAQLAQEQANRQAQSAELDRLRQQVDANRQAIQQRLDQDRAARVEAERQLDEAVTRYQTALAGGTPTEVETLRRQVEDQQIALRTVQEREKLNEQSMSAEIERLRAQLQTTQAQGTTDAQLLAQRQAEIIQRQTELEQLRKDREADVARRNELAQQQQQAIAEATRRRQEAEAHSQQLQQQVQAAQQQAQVAQQQAQATQAELERTKAELAAKDVEARRLRMQQELGRLASTRSEQRGLIVTLPGIFFDTGKSVLKAGAKNTLGKMAAQLKDDATLRISVEGHTDSVGSDDANQTLSEKRAAAVRDYLVSAGIAADHITSSGKGEAEPVATNKTVAGRQQNRRVELVITNG